MKLRKFTHNAFSYCFCDLEYCLYVQNCDSSKDKEGTKQDLKGRGLCLVPISSTYPVANETTSDFWTPTFGGTFR